MAPADPDTENTDDERDENVRTGSRDEAEPVPPGAPLARRGLYSEETAMDDSGTRLPVKEGSIVFRQPDVYLLGLDNLPDIIRLRPAAHTTRHILVRFLFDLNDLPAGHRFTWVSFHVWLDLPSARALILEPGRREVGADTDESGTPIPLITTWGQNSADFRWEFHARPGHPLRLGSATVDATLELPAETTILQGIMDGEATVAKPRLVDVETVDAKPTEFVPFRIVLPVSE